LGGKIEEKATATLMKTTPSHVFGQKELNPGKWEEDEIESRQTRRAKVRQKLN